MHSICSDGAETLESIVNACLERGWSCAGVTDHSYGLSIAGGMSMAAGGGAARGDRRAQPEACAAGSGCSRGSRPTSAPTAAIDMEPHEMRQFEFIVASPHSALRKSIDQTARMVAAVSQPGVAILGHPQGRVFNVRLGVLAGLEQGVRGGGAPAGGHRDRLVHGRVRMCPYELAAQALEQGCIFALDSDAHCASRIRFRRHRDCTRQARRHPAGADRQLLVGEEIPGMGRRRVGSIASPVLLN